MMNKKRILDGVWSRVGISTLRSIEGLGDVSDIDPTEVVTVLWPHVTITGIFGKPVVHTSGDVVFTTWKVEG